MPSNSDRLPEQDSGVPNTSELSPLIKNLSIATLVGIIAFVGVSSLIIAASQNNVNDIETTEEK
ncbi:MAG: hypothetical protein F6K23_02485 [Okeania sp. SIO2C9]|uniref:hypothetical protein n=1 Tax=Okeania sp. SIO2C9 TaxID=2607791 RepID=UPI0013C0D760|nr:hypothetical protein [Okeania sp. SIO2C9]NEQ72040.1 hypothetical protein [Okeania sp. SIO2C9]